MEPYHEEDGHIRKVVCNSCDVVRRIRIQVDLRAQLSSVGLKPVDNQSGLVNHSEQRAASGVEIIADTSERTGRRSDGDSFVVNEEARGL